MILALPAFPPPTAASPSPAPETSPLSPHQWQQLNDAHNRRTKLNRAARVAAFGGWVTAIIAASAGLYVLVALAFGWVDWVSAIIAAGLTVVAYHEFKGRRLLLAADTAGPRLLGWNQVGFAALIIAYSLWQIFTILTGQGPYAQVIEQEPALAQSLGDIQGMVTTIMLGVYILLILATLAFQGGTAWYYFTREKYVHAFRDQTPPWVIELLKRKG